MNKLEPSDMPGEGSHSIPDSSDMPGEYMPPIPPGDPEKTLSFKDWLSIQENIQGEYWIQGGMAMGADGDVNDFNHEGYATMIAQSEIAEEAVNDGYVDQQKYGWNDYGVDWNEFEQDLVNGFVEQHPEWANEDDHENVLQAAWREMGIDDELLMIAIEGGDTRNLAMKRWGWKAVRGNHIQTWTLTKADLSDIAQALGEMISFDNQNDFEVELEVMSTGKSFDVPISVIETGDPQKVVSYNRNAQTKGVQTAYDQMFKQMDKPSNPFYKGWGD